MTKEAKGKIWASRYYGGKEFPQSEQEIEVIRFPEGVTPARVKVSYGLTINMGNYESARVDAGVELPCYTEEVSDAYAHAWRLCEKELQEQVQALREGK